MRPNARNNVVNLGERVPFSAVGRRTNVDVEFAAWRRARRCVDDGALDEARVHLAEAQAARERVFSEVMRRPTVAMLAIMLRGQARLEELELQIVRAMAGLPLVEGEPEPKRKAQERRRRGRRS